MPTIHRDDGWKVAMYRKDHNPPHFHIITPDTEVQVRLDSLEIMAGRISARLWKQARSWALEHRSALEEAWQRLRAEENG